MKSSLKKSPWLIQFSQSKNAKFQLFCFAYAGGSAAIFRDWHQSLPEWVDLYAIQLPGRGARFSEPLIDSMESLIESLMLELEGQLGSLPYAFFGHSMGATIAFELTRRLQAQGKILPLQLMLSGRRAPTERVSEDYQTIHDLPQEAFFKRLKKLNGTPDELLANQDLMSLMEPVLRCDFKAIETWHFSEGPKLNVPITALSGKVDDHIDSVSLQAWAEQTQQNCEVKMFEGDHFYLHQHSQTLLKTVNDIILKLL